MFDVGFVELLMVGLVALLVVGPERLPGLARTAGLWLNKMRRMVSSVKRDIEQEIKADELKRILEEQKRKVPMHDIVEKTRGTVQDLKSGAKAALDPRPAKDEPNKTAGTNEHHSEP